MLEAMYQVTDRNMILSEPAARYVLRVKDLPEKERPRERLVKLGPAQLTTAELVAVLWGVGSPHEDVLAMANRALQEYGSKAIGFADDPLRVVEATGITLTKACQVVAAFELGRRFYDSGSAGKPVEVHTIAQAYQYLKSIGNSQKELLRGLYLNSRYQVVHDEVISIGSLTANIVHPREVFQPAIERGAVGVILAHNHPSGRIEATPADLDVTEQLIAAGDILGIELLDHIIVTSSEYASVMGQIYGD